MNKAKLIAISGVSSALALACLLVASFLRWFAVLAAAGAAIAVTIPLLIDKSNGVFSLLAYLASTILGCILGVANIGYVVIIAAFAMPFSMWKCFVEGLASVQSQDTTLQQDDIPTATKTRKFSKTALSVVKWVVYFAICEVALALTVLAMWLFTPSVFEMLVQKNYIYFAIAAGNLVVPLLNYLLTPAFAATRNILKKARIF